jgi:hypothetical protein
MAFLMTHARFPVLLLLFLLACLQESAAIAGSGLPDHCTWRWMHHPYSHTA